MEHEVWIPVLHRDLTGGVDKVKIQANTVGELIASLEARYPGIQERLTDEGRIRPHISLAINGEMVGRGLHQRLTQPSEVHFVPAIGGGR
jgi:sulfur-carrier protein